MAEEGSFVKSQRSFSGRNTPNRGPSLPFAGRGIVSSQTWPFTCSLSQAANASSASSSLLEVADGLNFVLFDLGVARDNGIFKV